MGAIATFSQAVSADAYTLIADGATYQTVGIYNRHAEQIAIVIAAALPGPNVDTYFKLPYDGFNITLGVADKLYAKPMNGAGVIRGYRTGV